MVECKSVATPLDQNLKLDADSRTTACELTQYRQLIESLIYLTITRPDLSYPVGLLSNSCKHRIIFIWIALSEYYDM